MAEGKEEKIELEGEVMEAFRNGMYRIALENGHETLGYTAGKMRRHRIRILPATRSRSSCRRTTSTAAGSSTATGRREAASRPPTSH